MKSFKYISIVLVALLTLVGCKEKMRELNTNADLVSDTQVAYMFTGATLNFDYSSCGSADDYYNSMSYAMQYHTYYSGPSVSGNPYYIPSENTETTPSYISGIAYSELFGQGKGNKLQSILTYIDQNVDRETDKKYEDVYAISKGLLAFMQWRVLENYGATVYSQAFKAIAEGITMPEYEYIEDVWDDIDAELEYCINILVAEPCENIIELGGNDFFGGYKITPQAVNGGVVTKVSDYDIERNNWLTFFNMLRLEIAWKLQGQESAHFDKVFSACQSVAAQGGIMNSIEDGFFFNYAHDYCSSENQFEPARDGVATDAWVTWLCNDSDPRLPYLARPNGATTETSVAFNFMKEYHQDSLDKYWYLDGKHPYMGVCANPACPQNMEQDENNPGPMTWISVYNKKFNNLPNPLGTAKFVYEDKNGESFTFCEQDRSEFDTKILIASEIQMRYWVVTGACHNADHGNWGNGLRVGNDEYYKRLHGDGGTQDEDMNIDIACRCRLFTYAKQCFLLAAINKTFNGVSANEWYERGIQAAFDDLAVDACIARNQAWVGGDPGFEYPDELTQVCGTTGNFHDVTFSFKNGYRISQDQIDAYIAAHPYNSIQDLMDQVYTYGYTDTYTAYTWYRRTGYPEFKAHAAKEHTYLEKHAWMETPYEGSEKLEFPRRGCLPNTGTINPNWYTAKQHLMAMEGFGDWPETSGGIWWEVPFMKNK